MQHEEKQTKEKIDSTDSSLDLSSCWGGRVQKINQKTTTSQTHSDNPDLHLIRCGYSKLAKPKKVSLDDVNYLIVVKQKATVEELFQSLIDEGLAYGYGVDETSVASYNDNIGDEVINSKGSRLLGIKSIGVSDTNFMVADFDYGSKMLNQQKKTQNQC